ncbi:UV radiation resistance-associated gene protein [Tachyglossus aculeatus]|uniref:UV radiation resistance-associated gene protein n=1 Tax=Tachyglossus aculeatus TaxID=9261 RepID=UPI0018F5708A|nr:UV radiation resistance-associated gene protein [Tachyglossus aculeatus]
MSCPSAPPGLSPLPPGPAASAATRSLHVELPSQQRRLRHLRSIAARNIAVTGRNGHRLLDTYFTLHLCSDRQIHREFYRSEVITNSLNPTWRSLDFGIMPDRLDTSVSCFVVRVWARKEKEEEREQEEEAAPQLLIEWKVSLDGLRFLGQQIHARNQNELIFGLNDGYYGAPWEQKGYSSSHKNNLLHVDQNCVRNSYDVFSLLRLHRAQCAIKQTQVTVQRIGREIEEKLKLTSTSNELKKESECLRLKILVLQNELERQQRVLGREVAQLQKQQLTLRDQGSAFEAERLKLRLHQEALRELRKACTAKREQFLKTNAQLTVRCRQLLSELAYIYPIDLNEQKDYFVCGVKLPNSEDFQARDDSSIAVALGYTAHLVSMISFFLQGPLRYPVVHKGSRSAIKDNINDKLADKEREFPLYPKGGEKLQFDYGVYLLNKNIAQLRYQHGLGTPDLRQTLPNLKSFLEHGLMVRCDRHHASSAIPVPKRQSATFGSADAGFSGGPPSPAPALRKRASSESERLPCRTPPPSYDLAVAQPTPGARHGEVERDSVSPSLSPSLDFPEGSERRGQGAGGGSAEEAWGGRAGGPGQHEGLTDHPGAVNGTLLPSEPAGPAAGADFCCTVERAEEIIGLEATGLSAGGQLEAFGCIPVDSAVAVECDDQVLGEFEEFSRRIYALNENVSSFRRPRKGSDK